MAVVLHMTAEEGSRLWHGFAGQGGVCFQEGSGSKPDPTLSRCRGPDFVSERYGDISTITGDERPYATFTIACVKLFPLRLYLLR